MTVTGAPHWPTIAVNGLPSSAQPPKRVLVLGAGMAGLVAAYHLRNHGHDVVILEARQRVGGRIHTVRDFAPGLYAEAGAMRIPRTHEATLAYCRSFGLPLRPAPSGKPCAQVHMGGRLLRTSNLSDHGVTAFPRAQHERGRPLDTLWQEAITDAWATHRNLGSAATDVLADKYDAYSIRGYLKAQGWSEGAIEEYGLMSFSETNLNTSVIQEFRETLGQAYQDLQEIPGGMDQLPMAFYQRIKDCIHFGTEIVRLERDETSVTVRARTASRYVTFSADWAICTLPFSVLRGVETEPAFSHGKRRAIRQLHYDAATKIYFQMRRPFWTDEGIDGGTTVTDLPVRRIIYPSVDAPDDRAMLLASYTYGQDALQWSALLPAQRVERALRQVARIHPRVEAEFEAGYSYSWYQDPYSMGAYALFEPEQESSLREAIRRPEGRVEFAGEHCSPWPAWVEGAVVSGLAAALRVHLADAR